MGGHEVREVRSAVDFSIRFDDIWKDIGPIL